MIDYDYLSEPLIQGAARFDKGFRRARVVVILLFSLNICLRLIQILRPLPSPLRVRVELLLELVCGISAVICGFLWFHREELE